MQKITCILLMSVMLFVLPTFSYAATFESFLEDIGMVLFIEAFVTIHMSIFVLFPLACILNKNKVAKTFWMMFFIRIVVLLYFDFFVSTAIAMVDFFAVFIGAFIIVPLAAIIKFKIDKKKREIDDASLNSIFVKEKKEHKEEAIIEESVFEEFIDTNDDPITRY